MPVLTSTPFAQGFGLRFNAGGNVARRQCRPAVALKRLRSAAAAFTALACAGAAHGGAPANEQSIQKLRLERFVMPEFPDFVRLTGSSRGHVTAAIGRDSEGHVDDVLLLESTHPRLSHAVTEAVRKWRFARPANQAMLGAEIVPIVRFIFTASGISIVSAATGPAVARDAAGLGRDDAPVVLPGVADLDSPAAPVHQPMPRISGVTRDRVTAGSATVKFFIDETGRVRIPLVLEATTPELGEAALAAVAQWRYEPPRIAGRATIAIETQTFQFAPAPR